MKPEPETENRTPPKPTELAEDSQLPCSLSIPLFPLCLSPSPFIYNFPVFLSRQAPPPYTPKSSLNALQRELLFPGCCWTLLRP